MTIDKKFYKTLFFVAVPITLQNLMQSMVNMLDSIMVGQLGSLEIAAVGLGNQIFFILNMILFGIASGGSIFIAQYWGKKDVANIRKTLGLMISFSLIISALFTVAALFFPKLLISFYSNDPKVIEVGGQYLRLVAISYPITAISFVVSQAFRSTEHVKLPMVATMISLVVNGVFNYLFIFGIGSFPAMGVSGAALATIISRFLEFFILYSVAKKNNYEALDSFKSMMSYNMYFIQRYIKIAFPVIVNETLWGFGVTLQNAIFAKISTDAIAAFNITGTISQLTWVFFIGIGNAAAIIIGKQIGAEDTQKALKYANKFALLMPILAIFIGALLFPLSKVLPVFFDVAPHIMAEATAMLMVLMVVYPLRSFNMCYIVGICRAGGDTVFAALCDVAAMWCIALPMGFLAGFILHLQPWLVFMFVVSEDIFKAALGVYRIKSKKWLHNVTR